MVEQVPNKMEQKKKILFLIHTLQIGGAEKVLVNLVNHMNAEKYDITVMTVINTGAFRSSLNSNIHYKTIYNIPFLSKKNKSNVKKSGNLLSGTSKIKGLLAKLYRFFWKHTNCKKIYIKHIKDQYDVEIAFLEGVSAKVIAASPNEKSKKIAWIHVDLVKENKTDNFFKTLDVERKTYEKFNTIVAVSEIVKEQFINKLKFSQKEKVLVKYNVIDEKAIIERSLESVNDIVKEKFTMCTIGRLAPQKGYDRLLKIVKKLNDEKLNFDLWIIGVGAEEKKLKDYIEENHIENARLLGYKENPYPYIKSSDLFVCSSRAEGFSTVVSEAIILEKPVVTTDCAGMRELLGNNSEYGMITENSEDSLYEGLKTILKDKEVYQHYQNKILERKSIFCLKNAVDEVEKLIEE